MPKGRVDSRLVVGTAGVDRSSLTGQAGRHWIIESCELRKWFRRRNRWGHVRGVRNRWADLSEAVYPRASDGRERMKAREKALVGLGLLKEAVCDYLSWSVLGLLVNEGKVRYDEGSGRKLYCVAE